MRGMRARSWRKSTPGLIAAATMSPKKSSARISLIFQRASASTTTATKIVDATSARRAVCLISVSSCPREPQRNRVPSGGSGRLWTNMCSLTTLTLMPSEELVVHGAREHNLKDVTVRLPRHALVCITGLSGSGKSSLAFDTIYAEGQRRYVESLSAYARQFLQMMEKPDVDSIDGLSPAISIDQKTTSRNPRSTVGTVTEIYDYLRLFFARVGRPHCPVCGRPIAGQSVETIVDQVLRPRRGRSSRSTRPSRATARVSSRTCSSTCAPRASRA